MASYEQVATEAANYEKKGNLKLAAMLWAKASDIARNNINRQYAQSRELFCIKYQGDN